MQLTRILFMLTFVITSDAFSLHSVPVIRTDTTKKTSSSCTSTLFRRKHMQSSWSYTSSSPKMSNEESQEEKVEGNVTSSSSSTATSVSNTRSGKAEDKSAVITAILLAAPLMAKFGVVILVKIVTDMVVIPLLQLYKMFSVVKNRVVGIFAKSSHGSIMKGDEVNGLK